MPTGFIKTLTIAKQYGFIHCRDTGTDYFFHASGLTPPLVIDDLDLRDKVEFTPTIGDRGPRATNIQLAASSSIAA